MKPNTQLSQNNLTSNKNSKSPWIFLGAMVAIIALTVWVVISLAGMLGGDRKEILKNGVSTEGISSGKVFEGQRKRAGRGGSIQQTHQAYYTYYDKDGRRHSVIGEKDYQSADNIREGMKATVVYLPDDPDEAEVTNEE